MSSTYVSNYYAAALRRTCGYAYVMFYETCESNVDPRTPRWRAHHAGTLPEVLSAMVEYVDCCDGGMTKGARGRPIRSETFVRRSEAALAAANLLTGRVTLEFGPFGRAIALEKLTAFDGAAARAGISIHFTRDGEQHAMRPVDLSDPATVDVLLAFQRDAQVAAWQIFNMADMAHLPSQGDWTPSAATPKELAHASDVARQHLAAHRVVKMRYPWPGSDYVQEEQLVLDSQHQVLSPNPLRWFCQDFLAAGRLMKLGESLAAMKVFRAWMDAAMVGVDAPACEVMATATAESEEASARIAEKLTGGRSHSLPARGPASAVFNELRYSDAARFSLVLTRLGNDNNRALF